MSKHIADRLAPLAHLESGQLLIHEIYSSIQGESTYAGQACVFVRSTACGLRCRYCDTAHAFFDGNVMTVDEVLTAVAHYKLPLVELTGGEPLLQPAALPLMTALCDRGLKVLLETSGAVDIANVDRRVVKIMDLKTPGSGEVDANLFGNLRYLQPHDEVKIVLVDRNDYDWAKEQLLEHHLPSRCTTHFSAAFGRLDAKDLAAWIVADRLPVRLQLQLHKYIWAPSARGV